MYWPVGTPRIYASSNLPSLNVEPTVSNDGLPPQHGRTQSSSDLLSVNDQTQPPKTPVTPATPFTPGIRAVDDGAEIQAEDAGANTGAATAALPLHDPIVAVAVARQGFIFVTITATSIAIWQVKPTVILAIVVRSAASLTSYGNNSAVFFRPDSAILVVRTSSSYLITYSLATDPEALVYKSYFPNPNNTLTSHRRRQSQWSSGVDNGQIGVDQIAWGPGEGRGVQDLSVRFRMVIKVDAGISDALAMDEEVIVATKKPAAVQCIRWTPSEDSGSGGKGGQTSTELLSKMSWVSQTAGNGGNGTKRTSAIAQMVYDRSMNLLTWITADGKAFAVQRTLKGQIDNETGENDIKKLFKGHCFHTTENEANFGVQAAINPKFSLIALGCADGSIQVYSVMDYAGKIPHSHIHKTEVSVSHTGRLTTLSYSPDGYCLFAGYENGWATWSVYGMSLSTSFNDDKSVTMANNEKWLQGVRDAAWLGSGSELLLTARESDSIWVLEMARSAVTGCYSSPNLFRTVLQTPSTVMVYRGYDLPDMSTISAEPFLWHTARIPANYLLNQWPIRTTVVSSDGRYLAIAGRRGLAHYSVNSGRWKTFSNPAVENEFQVRGGMCWYQNILIAAVEANKTYELRLFARERDLDSSSLFHLQQIPAPIILITPSRDDGLLVYTADNLLRYFVFVAAPDGSIKFVQFGRMSFHGIVRAPARIRGISWLLPESQLFGGDPAQDVEFASVLILVDGKLVLLRPTSDADGNARLDMRVIAHNVEYFISMRDLPSFSLPPSSQEQLQPESLNEDLTNSLWVFDGTDLKVWTDMEQVLQASEPGAHCELPAPVSLSVDFYPLSVLFEKAVVLGLEPELVQRREISFSSFRFSIRTQLILPAILRHHLTSNNHSAALRLARQFSHLAYFPHALEILLHHVLDEEVDMSPPPTPEEAILPRVLTLLSSFKQYLDIVVQCTRKTEVRSWKTLFAYLPPAQELFEESLQRGSLKTAGGYLLILHTFDEDFEPASVTASRRGSKDSDVSSGRVSGVAVSEQSVRLLKAAMVDEDWELCKELARFLAAMDESGDTLREALDMVGVKTGVAEQVQAPAMSLLQVPTRQKQRSAA